MSLKAFRDVVIRLCEDLNTPRSLCVSLLLRNNEDRQLCELTLDPKDYLLSDVKKFADDYLITEYLSKYTGLRTGINTLLVAQQSFQAAEQQCHQTNDRLSSNFDAPDWVRWAPVIMLAQQKIEAVIGFAPKFMKMTGRCRWSGGSTLTIRGEAVRPDNKLCEEQISITRQALQLFRAAVATDYAFLYGRGVVADGPTSLTADHFQVVRGSRGVAVPKNAKTDRFIAAEPTGNIFLQLGVGDYLRQCLRRVGVDLDNQEINQSLAREALDRGLATVDLKAASDTISSALVWQLLPYQWAVLLDKLRSPQMLVDEEWIHLHKFSSMGNGFTFELESLIFWALTSALCDHCGYTGSISVYGDDIICPTEAVSDLVSLFAFVGFVTNVKKTHHSSLFRESCGKHYFGGTDVTPIYQKTVPLAKDVAATYRSFNRLLYHAIQRGSVYDGIALHADSAFRGSVSLYRELMLADRRIAHHSGRGFRHEIPITKSIELRVLDGGVLTDVRSLRHSKTIRSRVAYLRRPEITGSWLITTDTGSAAPRLVAKEFNDSNGVGWGDGYWSRVLAFVPEPVPSFQDAMYALHLREKARVASDRPGIVTSIPFDGNVTLRGRGRWRTINRCFSETCELRWSPLNKD